MKNLIVTTLFLLLCTVFALAQTPGNQSSNSTTQSGTSTSSGSTSSGSQDTMAPPSTQSQTGTSSTSSGSQDTMGTKSQSTASTKSDNKEKEKKITGCLESAGSGQYAIEHKGKKINVVPSSAVSSEIANHVGHKVKLSGTWEQASAATSGTSTMAGNTGANLPQSDQPGAAGGTSTSGKAKEDKNAKEFRADKIEMVSDSCGGKSKSDTSSNPNPKPY